MAGGAVMAMFSMIMLRLAGSGFWTALNLIAHTFWRSAPVDGRFSVAALATGMAVHLTMAMLFGIAHLMFGMLAATFAGIVIEDADPPPRHALPPAAGRAAQLVHLTLHRRLLSMAAALANPGSRKAGLQAGFSWTCCGSARTVSDGFHGGSARYGHLVP
jgi:hypothetical protein